MPLTYEHVGSKKPAKINTYMLTRAELLITLCYEISCNIINKSQMIVIAVPKDSYDRQPLHLLELFSN